MSAQLRFKIEALQGSQRSSTLTRTPPTRSRGLTAAESHCDPADALGDLGFSWDQSRSLWVRSYDLSLGELGLDSGAFHPPGLASLWPAVGERLDGPVVLFDLETTGLQRGTGTVPFLYGWAAVTGDGIRVEQWLLPDLGQESPLVEAAFHMLKQAGLVVTYNGASFDLPLVRTRAVMTGVEKAWPATPHLDLLPLVRRLFRHRLTRCTLRRAEEELLGRPRIDDLPGSEAPDRYRSYLKDGDSLPLAPVLRHNLLDLLSLARLIDHLEQHLEVARPEPADWYSLGRYAEDRGNLQRADTMYLGAQAESPPPLDRAAALRRTRMLRRQGRDAEARAAWRAIWERWQDPEAAEALCVELEHQQGDLSAALALAQDALSTAPIGWDRRFAKRIWRLQARLDLRGLRDPELARARPAAEPSAAERPWAAWLPGGTSYEAWLALRRGPRGRAEATAGSAASPARSEYRGTGRQI